MEVRNKAWFNRTGWREFFETLLDVARFLDEKAAAGVHSLKADELRAVVPSHWWEEVIAALMLAGILKKGKGGEEFCLEW